MVELIQGREAAFDELYRRYADRLHYYFYRMLGKDQEVANDFTQELFTRVIEKASYFDPSQRFSSWLYAVASNMCKNEYRRRDYQSRLDIPEIEAVFQQEGYYLASNADRQLFSEQLTKALDQLDYSHRQCFILRFQQELSIREISEIMSCPEGTVKSRIYYTLRKLAEQLKFFHPDFSKKKTHEKYIR